MLKAYFDESGTSGSEPMTVLSGFVALNEKWNEFDALWRSALKHELKDLGLDWFHMVECENGEGQFINWNAKPEIRRFAAKTMADVIVKSGLTGFWSSVDVQDWAGPIPGAAFKVRYPKPYYFCFENILAQVVAWMNEFAPGEGVELIFSEQNEYQDRAEAIFDAYVREKAIGPLRGVRFASMTTCAPLQAADMAVYCTNKEMESAVYAKETKERIYRDALDILYWNDSSFTGHHHDGLSFLES